MEKTINKVLNIYNIILLTALMVVGFKSVKSSIDLIFPFLLMPVFFYMTGGLIRQFKKTNWLFFIYSFLFSIIILIADLGNVRHLKDLVLVGIVLPLPTYLLIIFVEKIKSFKHKKELNEPMEMVKMEEDKKDVDEAKRKFLKLLAGTGLTTVFLYMFNAKKANAAFFGNGGGSNTLSLKNSTGEKIDPATDSPLDGYVIANIEENVALNYFGFTNKKGNWYIMRINNTNNSFSYFRGDVEYLTGWQARTTDINFKTFAETF